MLWNAHLYTTCSNSSSSSRNSNNRKNCKSSSNDDSSINNNSKKNMRNNSSSSSNKKQQEQERHRNTFEYSLTFISHISVWSLSFPSQSLPPFCGAGESHSLPLLLTPRPQVALQYPQGRHSDQAPSTAQAPPSHSDVSALGPLQGAPPYSWYLEFQSRN